MRSGYRIRRPAALISALLSPTSLVVAERVKRSSLGLDADHVGAVPREERNGPHRLRQLAGGHRTVVELLLGITCA